MLQPLFLWLWYQINIGSSDFLTKITFFFYKREKKHSVSISTCFKSGMTELVLIFKVLSRLRGVILGADFCSGQKLSSEELSAKY